MRILTFSRDSAFLLNWPQVRKDPGTTTRPVEWAWERGRGRRTSQTKWKVKSSWKMPDQREKKRQKMTQIARHV
jgi:hypothetical protein